MKKSECQAKDIAAIGITNQRETVVVWDKATGKPIHNAIVWQDRRTSAFCQKLKKAGKEALFTKKTGLLLDPYFSGTKLAWLLDKVPGARKRAAKGELLFGTIDSFLIWRLTGGKVHATDATNASRTLMYNIAKNEWDSELLKILNVPAAMLPQVKDCADDFGVTRCQTVRRANPDSWRGGRPAGGDHRAGLFRAGDDEINLRHRLFCTLEYRRRHGALEEPAIDNDRLSARTVKRPMPLKARSLLPVPVCSGCAMG